MSRKHSFIITLNNNKTERAGIDYLVSLKKGFFLVDKAIKKQILEALELPTKYSRTFDMIYIPDSKLKVISKQEVEVSIADILILELKTTQKHLPNLPQGFFFGATENEFELARKLGNKFRFCLISLNIESPNYILLTLQELEEKIKNKRIQYQINL